MLVRNNEGEAIAVNVENSEWPSGVEACGVENLFKHCRVSLFTQTAYKGPGNDLGCCYNAKCECQCLSPKDLGLTCIGVVVPHHNLELHPRSNTPECRVDLDTVGRHEGPTLVGGHADDELGRSATGIEYFRELPGNADIAILDRILGFGFVL